MRHADTVDKIVAVYLASVCDESFSYKKKIYRPKELVVSPLLIRGYTCPAVCGACCGNFSLDFLPEESQISSATPRSIVINDTQTLIHSDLQSSNLDRWCKYLDRSTARCLEHGNRPMACDFELIRFLTYEDHVLLIQKQYGRAWAMRRLDGNLGAACEMLPASPMVIEEVVRKLNRLDQWARHFGISTRISKVIDWIEAGDTSIPLRIPTRPT